MVRLKSFVITIEIKINNNIASNLLALNKVFQCNNNVISRYVYVQ